MATKIFIGSDHAGFKLKEKLKVWLKKNKIKSVDLGNLKYIPTDDYPDYAEKVVRQVVKTKSKGILICGSAQGVCIAANKVKGIRAVIPFSVKEAQLSREHLDANVLCLSGWYFSQKEAEQMVDCFLKTKFSKEPRHIRRINKIKKLERKEN